MEFSVIVEVHTELTVSWAAIEVGGQTLRTIVNCSALVEAEGKGT